MLAAAGGVTIEPEIAQVTVVRGHKRSKVWFQDLFNYDFRRTEMCIIPYATQMGEISFCAYNYVGIRKHGFRYVEQFMGPSLWEPEYQAFREELDGLGCIATDFFPRPRGGRSRASAWPSSARPEARSGGRRTAGSSGRRSWRRSTRPRARPAPTARRSTTSCRTGARSDRLGPASDPGH